MATSEPDAGSRRDQVVVSLRGELDIVNTAALGPLAAAAIRGQFVVVDLAGLDSLDCSAVRCLCTRSWWPGSRAVTSCLPTHPAAF